MNKITLYNSTAGEDMLMCICTTLFTAWFNADSYLPEEPMKWVRIACFAAMSVCWFSMAFFNGLRMRSRFAAWMECFLIIPAFLLLICEIIRPLKFSDAGILIHDLCSMISRLPYSLIEGRLNVNGSVCAVITAILSLLMYSAGYLYTQKLLSDAVGSDGGKD